MLHVTALVGTLPMLGQRLNAIHVGLTVRALLEQGKGLSHLLCGAAASGGAQEDGENAVAWPNELALKNSSFAILPDGQSMQQIRMRLIAPIPTREQTLQVLHGQRCRMQFEAFLRGFLVSQR